MLRAPKHRSYASREQVVRGPDKIRPKYETIRVRANVARPQRFVSRPWSEMVVLLNPSIRKILNGQEGHHLAGAEFRELLIIGNLW
jgi:hypothetical protein